MGDTSTSSHAQLSSGASGYSALTPDERTHAVRQLSALLAATHAELLQVIAAADASKDWEADGATGMASWLVGQLGIATPSAREWIRVATQLQGLPALHAAYAGGQLSWDQLRPATHMVTSADDERHAVELPACSAAQIGLMARQRRPISDRDASHAHTNRGLSWHRDHRVGGYRYRGFLPFDQGEVVNVALQRQAESMGADPATGVWAPLRTRLADSLHDLATRALAEETSREIACVVIHADATVIDGDVAGNGFIGDLAISRHGVMRALCDSRVEVALHGEQGRTVGIARASRLIPPWLRRAVSHRDRGCRFPGCERRLRQVHHIRAWTTGAGETNADNLVGLCWTHHRLVHEGGWSITGDPERRLTFTSPNGRRLYSSAQSLRHDIRRHVSRSAGVELHDSHWRSDPERGPPGPPGPVDRSDSDQPS